MAGRFLFLLAHPDDEFACSMRIRALVREGGEVHCAYLTDGGYGGQPVERRRHESLRVLRRLGVPPERAHFIGEQQGLPDGGLHSHLDRAYSALEALLARIGALDGLHVPAWEGGHQDHDAVHLLGLALAVQHTWTGSLRQFPLYHGAGLPGPFFRVLAPLAENGTVRSYTAPWPERLLAIRLCLAYASQWRTWVGLLPFFALHMLCHGTFPEQAVDPRRVRATPHAGQPLYERRGFLTYARFREAADAFLAARNL